MTQSMMATVLSLVIATSSPAAQQSVSEAQSWRAVAATLEPAALVSVRLKDGKRVVGTVLAHSEDSLVLKPRTRVPVAARAIAFTDIESIERKKAGWSPGAKVLFGAGVGVGAVMLGTLIVYALLAGYD